MSHVVSGKLRKAPFTKDGCGQEGQSKMYVLELAEVIKDWQTQENQYTNYKAMFFAKTDNAKAFYDRAFAEGSFVVVACEKIKAEVFNAENGNQYITLNMANPRLEGCLPVSDMNGQPQMQTPPAQQQQPQMAQQQPQYQPQNRPAQGQPQQPPQPQNQQAPNSWGNKPQQQGQQQAPKDPAMDFDQDIPF